MPKPALPEGQIKRFRRRVLSYVQSQTEQGRNTYLYAASVIHSELVIAAARTSRRSRRHVVCEFDAPSRERPYPLALGRRVQQKIVAALVDRHALLNARNIQLAPAIGVLHFMTKMALIIQIHSYTETKTVLQLHVVLGSTDRGRCAKSLIRYDRLSAVEPDFEQLPPGGTYSRQE